MPTLSIRIKFGPKGHIGPGKVELLEQIAAFGSISAGARQMGMSYKRAWSLVQALNAGFGGALVLSARGGKEQGASLTAAGREVLERYRGMQEATRRAIARDVEALAALHLDMSERK